MALPASLAIIAKAGVEHKQEVPCAQLKFEAKSLAKTCSNVLQALTYELTLWNTEQCAKLPLKVGKARLLPDECTCRLPRDLRRIRISSDPDLRELLHAGSKM